MTRNFSQPSDMGTSRLIWAVHSPDIIIRFGRQFSFFFLTSDDKGYYVCSFFYFFRGFYALPHYRPEEGIVI